MTSSRRQMWMLNHKLSLLKDGEHYNKDNLTMPIKEKMLLKTPDKEESNVEQSKALLAQLPASFATKRDLAIDYRNPREELPKFGKFVDEIPAFDKPPPSLLTGYDQYATQSVNQVIQGRTSFIKEENKYNMTLETGYSTSTGYGRDSTGNLEDKSFAGGSKPGSGGGGGMQPSGGTKTQQEYSGQGHPPPTPQIAAELARASFQETTSVL